jgi:hypothetical protein
LRQNSRQDAVRCGDERELRMNTTVTAASDRRMND